MKFSNSVAIATIVVALLACVVSGAPFQNDGSKIALVKCDVVKGLPGQNAAIAPLEKQLKDHEAKVLAAPGYPKLIDDAKENVKKANAEPVVNAKKVAYLESVVTKLENEQAQADAAAASPQTKVLLQTAIADAKLKITLPGIAGSLAASTDPWTLHGLWPDNVSATPAITATTASPTVVVPATFATHWLDCQGGNHKKLTDHEWTKHGRNTNGNGGVDTIYTGPQAEQLYYKHALDLLPAAAAECDKAAANKGRHSVGSTLVAEVISTSDCVVYLKWDKAGQAWSVIA